MLAQEQGYSTEELLEACQLCVSSTEDELSPSTAVVAHVSADTNESQTRSDSLDGSCSASEGELLNTSGYTSEASDVSDVDTNRFSGHGG